MTEKFSRGFDHLIYIWGADHHGTVARVRNAAEAMGYDRDAVEMLLYSLGPLRPRRREVSMSQAGRRVHHPRRAARRGRRRRRALVLRLTRARRPAIDFDIELAKKQSNENPVYYVQYAHARIASILRKAAEAGLAPAGRRSRARSAGAPEAALARAIARFPEVVEDAVAAEETQGITAYATELATTFHAFYRDARVVDADEPERSAARLALGARDAGHARERARAAGDLRARVDVGAALSPPRPRTASDLRDASRRRSRRRPSASSRPCPARPAPTPPAVVSAVVAAASNSAASAGGVPGRVA